MLALNGEHHGAHLAGLWRSPKSMEVRSKNDSAIRHAGELTHPGLSNGLVTLNKGILFLLERSGNVVENKGALWKKPERSANVIENKGSYALKAGMLLKTQVVSAW